MIRFLGINADVPQLLVLNSDTDPLVGVNVNVNGTTWLPYTPTTIFYEPVPYEFMYTPELKPQVIVSVEGLEAACDSLNCGYTYIQPTAQITDFSLSGTTLTITGTDLPSVIKTIQFSNVACTNIVVTDTTTITCTVIAVAGSWQPIVTDANGYIPINATNVINVPLTVTSVSPNANLNPNGGTTITISGVALP
jgi:hypothetical protein